MATTLPTQKTLPAINPAPVGREGSYIRLADINGLLDHTSGWVNVKSYGAVGDGTTDDTAAIVAALTAADGGSALLPKGTYKVTSLVINITQGLSIQGYGATLTNTSQTAASGGLNVPILRIKGTATTDVSIEGLSISGPRTTGNTTTPSGTYATTGYPSGIDIFTARNVVIRNVKASGTYYAGIEAHYTTATTVRECDVSNHGYAGIDISDTDAMVVDGNRVDDIGYEMITAGYGITAATSYSGTGYNRSVSITGNTVTKTKRKGIDVHSGLDVRIVGNSVKGFGNAGLYATCEGVDKQVRDVVMSENLIEGDSGFVATASVGGIDLGAFGASVSQAPTFTITNNTIKTLSAAYVVALGNPSSGANTVKSLVVSGNTTLGVTMTSFVGLNNNAVLVGSVTVTGNVLAGTYSGNIVNLRTYTQAVISGNSFSGSFSSLVGDDGSGKLTAFNNLANANPTQDFAGVKKSALQAPVGGTGSYFAAEYETFATAGATPANVDLLIADLSPLNDTTVAVDVEVIGTGANTTGSIRWRQTVYGTRTGAANAVWTPGTATNMTVEATAYGALTAPKLIWNASTNVATLQLQPQATFSAYRVRARSISWRGYVVPQ